MNLKIIFILFLLFLYTALSQEPQPASGEPTPIKLRYADTLRYFETPSGPIRECAGNVQFEQDNVIVISDRAIQYMDLNKAELVGNVFISQEDLLLKSPRIVYDGNTGIAEAQGWVMITDKNAKLKAKEGTYNTQTYIADFEGRVRMQDDSTIITSDKIRYNRKTRESLARDSVKIEEDSVTIYCDILEHARISRESHAYGGVVVIGKYTNILLTGDTVINIPYHKYTFASGRPAIIQVDTLKKTDSDKKSDSLAIGSDSGIKSEYKFDTLWISSDKMEAFREGSEYYVFDGNVALVKGNTSAVSGNAVYYKDYDFFGLSVQPVVWYDSTQLRGDSIEVRIPGRKLNLIHALSNALVAMRDDTLNLERINQITGSDIRVHAEKDTIRAITSFGDAKSLYFMVSESGNDGAARNGADTIYIDFDKGEAHHIRWLGGVQGEYFPENIINNKVKDYYLPSFRWSEVKPQKKSLELRNVR